jgi:hypothetical protein
VIWPDAPGFAVDDLIGPVRLGFVALTYGEWHENRTKLMQPAKVAAALRDPKCWPRTGRELERFELAWIRVC